LYAMVCGLKGVREGAGRSEEGVREETGRSEGGDREEWGQGGVREVTEREVSFTLSSLMVCTHWAIEASVGTQYSFMSFSLQEDEG